MKLRLISFLLAISTIFSVQAVTIRNVSSENIDLTNFVSFLTNGEERAWEDTHSVKSFGEMDTTRFFKGEVIVKLTAHINGSKVEIKELCAESILFFFEDENGVVRFETMRS